MGHRRFSAREIGERAQAIYDREIRANVEPLHKGSFLVLDIESGKYEIGDDYIAIARKMQAEKPSSALFTFKIGSPAVAKIGAGSRCVTE